MMAPLMARPQALHGEVEGTANVVVDATRHIVSTTVTTIGGFVPLIVAGGTFWPPLATAIAGGVSGSAIIALYMVPAVFIALKRRQLRKQPRPANDEVIDVWVETENVVNPNTATTP